MRHALAGLATVVVLLGGGCYRSSPYPVGSCDARLDHLTDEMTRTSPWSCTAVLRLDFMTMEPLGFRLFCGETRSVSEEEARERAAADVRIDHEYTDFLTARMLNEPDPDDVYIFYEDAGDFGGVAVVSPYTGKTLFGGSTIWSGYGELTFPRSWSDPGGLGPGCGSGEPLEDVTVYPWAEVIEDGDLDAIIAVVEETAVPDAMRGAGELVSASVLFYAESVGVLDPDTASWIVFLNASG